MWVSPSFGVKNKKKKWLLALSSSADVVWYAVMMGDHGDLSFELVGGMKKGDLSCTLQKIRTDCAATTISSLKLLGSHNGEALLCVNGSLVCRLGLDSNHRCVQVQSCLCLETSLQDFSIQVLPKQLVGPIECCFKNPLLLVLYQCGFTKSVALMVKVMSSQFSCLSISSNLSKLIVGTTSGQVVVVDMVKYFSDFPCYYSTTFLKSILHKKNILFAEAKVDRVQPLSTVMKENEDSKKYITSPQGEKKYSSTTKLQFYGYQCWTKRLSALEWGLGALVPSYGSFNLKHSWYTKQGGKRGGICERKKRIKLSVSTDTCHWYEGPNIHKCTSYLSYSGISQPPAAITRRQSQDLGNSGPLAEGASRHLHYRDSCLLPLFQNCVDMECQVIHIEASYYNVMAYYAARVRRVGNYDGKAEQVFGMARYLIDQKEYSVIRLPYPSYMIRPCVMDLPLYLVNESTLSLVTLFQSCEEFYNKVYTYSNLKVFQDLLCLNCWDRCFSHLTSEITHQDLARQHDTTSSLKDKTSAKHEGIKVQQNVDESSLASSSISHAVSTDQEKLYSQFAVQVTAATLNFLRAMVDSQTEISTGKQGYSRASTQHSDNIEGIVALYNVEGTIKAKNQITALDLMVMKYQESILELLKKKSTADKCREANNYTDADISSLVREELSVISEERYSACLVAEKRASLAEESAKVADLELSTLEKKLMNANAQVSALESRCKKADNTIKALSKNVLNSDAKIAELKEINTALKERITEAEKNFHEITLELQCLQEHCDKKAAPSWVLDRHDISVTDKEIGRGAWGVVKVAKFCGLDVAAKFPHGAIISKYTQQLFTREMSLSALVRHPNIILFIGATIDQECIILTELMPTSLRAVLENNAKYNINLSHQQVSTIAIDVGRALKYLHFMKPDTIIHRDVSSSNVLLALSGQDTWRAKLSDFGSSNFAHQILTVGPGNITYAAPESFFPEQQSSKMDVFSYGILLLEMSSGEFPEASKRKSLIEKLTWSALKKLIMECISVDPNSRPNMTDILLWFNT